MNQNVLEHLERIEHLCEGLTCHPAWDAEQYGVSFDKLTSFDEQYWTFTRYLSFPLYQETSSLLRQGGVSIPTPPRIAVVIAVYRPDPELLRLSINSAMQQVGVHVHLHLSLDGPEGDPALVEQILRDLQIPPSQVTVHTHPENRGVALCRNAALATMQEDWFTFLDCDDIFHPLRLLHAWLSATSLGVIWLNTGCSRVSLREKKIFLAGQSLSAIGFNSFIASRQVLAIYGYLSPLRFWEDSEYQNRLAYFQAPMMSCTAVGHYANTELEPSRWSLGSRWRQEAYPITSHPYLCGSILGGLDQETLALREHFRSLYAQLELRSLPHIFPAEGNPDSMPKQQGKTQEAKG